MGRQSRGIYLPRLTVARTINGRALARVRYDEPDRCWLWTGMIDRGYGVAAMGKGKQLRAHRVIYELLVGPIPEGLHLDHLCRVRSCVNPRHLEPVTAAENSRRQADALRKPTCPKGHSDFGHVTRHTGEVNRYCRPCAKANAQRQRDRKAQR